MEKKQKFETLASSVRKNAKSVFDGAIQAIDQNDDGKFDFSDVSAIADSVGAATKKGVLAIKENAKERTRQLETKTLQPIFSDTLTNPHFFMTKFIQVTDRDKKHTESEVCQGSIGYMSNQKGLHMVHIFRDSITAFGLSFYPDPDCEFYYIDPCSKNHYIALNEYFGYLKSARINELQKLAQDLGAKHFRVTYKEEQASLSKSKAAVSAQAKNVAAASTEHDSTEKKYAAVKIEAELEFLGHPPVKPKLKYMKHDPSIQNLVAMRMDEKAPLARQKLVLELSKSSGIKESDAAKIDAALKGLKCSGNMTVSSEVKNESRRYLEYDIEF